MHAPKLYMSCGIWPMIFWSVQIYDEPGGEDQPFRFGSLRILFSLVVICQGCLEVKVRKAILINLDPDLKLPVWTFSTSLSPNLVASTHPRSINARGQTRQPWLSGAGEITRPRAYCPLGEETPPAETRHLSESHLALSRTSTRRLFFSSPPLVQTRAKFLFSTTWHIPKHCCSLWPKKV